MAYALSNTQSGFNLSATLHNAVEAWKVASAKRAVFNRTFNELNALDDRDLPEGAQARTPITRAVPPARFFAFFGRILQRRAEDFFPGPCPVRRPVRGGTLPV